MASEGIAGIPKQGGDRVVPLTQAEERAFRLAARERKKEEESLAQQVLDEEIQRLRQLNLERQIEYDHARQVVYQEKVRNHLQEQPGIRLTTPILNQLSFETDRDMPVLNY